MNWAKVSLKPVLRSKTIYFPAITLAVALIWVLLFELNQLFFSHFKITDNVNLIFLPAAARLLAILLFKQLGVMGLFLGGIFTVWLHIPNTTFSDIAIISAISALSPYISVTITKYCLEINDLLSSLHKKQLLIICAFYSIINSLCHNLYFYFTQPAFDFSSHFLTMMLGDFIGCILVLYLISLFMQLRKLSHIKK